MWQLSKDDRVRFLKNIKGKKLEVTMKLKFTWYLSVLFFLFGAAFFVFLMINDVINRKVFIEENVLTIKLLWIKKQI